MLRKIIGLGFLVLGLVTLVGSSAVKAQEKLPPWTYGTTSTGSAWYAKCVAQANVWNKYVGTSMTPVETKATNENIRRIAKGEFIASGADALDGGWMARNGVEDFKDEKVPELRVLFADSLAYQCAVVTKKSGIKSYRGIDRKAYCPGVPGSTTEQNSRRVAATLGIKPDFRATNLTEAAEAVKDGRIIGLTKGEPVTYVGGKPTFHLTGAVLETHIMTPMTIVSFSKEDAATVQKKCPWLPFMTIPAGAVAELPDLGEIYGWAMLCGVHTSTKLPPEVAYRMVKAMIEHQGEVVPAFKPLSGFDIPKRTIEFLMSYGEPRPLLHAGTVKYFKEIKVDIPKELIPPEYKN